MKVVVTGANGFIGKNLLARLQRIEEIEVATILSSDRPEAYAEKLADASLVYHLAGVNRPLKEEDFQKGNADLTAHLLEAIAQLGSKPQFILSSSTQATADNPYGKSKLAAEQQVEQFAEEGHIYGVIYRLPGVFGKWCRPNYNSVVATFCHNIAQGLPIEVRDPAYSLPLVYIDDVIEQWLGHLNESSTSKAFEHKRIRTVFQATLGDLAEIIQSFPESRRNLQAPQVGDPFTKRLYSTYLSYLPTHAFAYDMELRVDNRGWLFEWIKSEAFGQIFVSTTKPGITRGNHFHHTKTEKFLVIQGEATVCFRKIDQEEVVEYRVSGNRPQVVDIPPGYTHNITNVGDQELITLFWANEIFDQERPDTYFLEV